HTRCLSDWSSDVCSSDLNEVPLIARAVVVVKGWHTESFSSAVLAHAPEIFRFVERAVFQRAAKTFGGGGPPTKILVVPALPQSRSEERRVGQGCGARGRR